MGFFKKLKKKAKKLTLKKVGKALSKSDALKDLGKVASFLPSPVGNIAQIATKGMNIKEKLNKAKNRLKKSVGGSTLDMLSKASKGKLKKSREDRRSSSSSNAPQLIDKRALRRQQREAKKRARRDGYSRY